MAFIVVLFILIAFRVSGCSGAFELSSYIRNFSHTVCPFTDYCSTKSTGVLQDEVAMPCCSECSCDVSICYRTENCCPDIEQTTIKTSDLVCADTMTKFIKGRIWSPPNHNGIENGIKRYFIITYCPKEYKDDFVNSKCRGDNQTDLDDFLWVSNVNRHTIYQNYYCALCHKVVNWVNWNLRTNCYARLLETGFKNITTTLLSDECNIVNEAPESKVAVSRTYRCYIPDFTSCNKTGEWSHYDPNTEKACHSFTQHFFKQEFLFETFAIYKNVFCWLCNAKPDDDIPTLCPDLKAGSSRKPFESFSALIDFIRLEKTNRDSILDSRRCSSGEIYDECFRQCRTLECPLGSLAVDGVCEEVIFSIGNHGGLKILFKVVIYSNWTVIAATNDNSQFGQIVAEELEDLIGLHKCGNCSASAYTDLSSYSGQTIKVDVYFEKSFTPSCQLDLIHRNILASSGKQIEIQLTSLIRLAATATIAEKADYERFMYYRFDRLFSRSDNFCSFGTSHLQVTEPLCPRIQIAFSESKKLRHGTKKQNLLTFFENLNQKNDTTIVHVCTTDYFNVMRQTNGSSSRHQLGYCIFFMFYKILLLNEMFIIYMQT